MKGEREWTGSYVCMQMVIVELFYHQLRKNKITAMIKNFCSYTVLHRDAEFPETLLHHF